MQGLVELTSDANVVRIWPDPQYWVEVELTTQTTHRRGEGSPSQYFRALWGLYSPGGSYRAFVQHAQGTVQFFDFVDDRLLGTIVNLTGDSYLSVSPDGHVRSDLLTYDREIVYLVKRGDVFETYRPKEFNQRFEWKNAAHRVRFGRGQ